MIDLTILKCFKNTCTLNAFAHRSANEEISFEYNDTNKVCLF